MLKKARCVVMCDGCGELVWPGQEYHANGGLLYCVPCQKSRENDDSYDEILGRMKCGLGS